MARFTEYVLTPRDIVTAIRGMGPRDWLGLALALAIAVAVGWWLRDAGAGAFAAGLVIVLYWRIDSRWPFGLALALLVLIPLMQLAYQQNILFGGEAIAQNMAVAVWYLLVMGVVRQLAELKGLPATTRATAPAATPATPAERVPGEPIPFHRSLRRQRMVARRVEAKVERTRTGMDGIRRTPRS